MRLYTPEWLFMRLADQITEYDRTVAGMVFSQAQNCHRNATERQYWQN
jgi:hypothetical protein